VAAGGPGSPTCSQRVRADPVEDELTGTFGQMRPVVAVVPEPPLDEFPPDELAETEAAEDAVMELVDAARERLVPEGPGPPLDELVELPSLAAPEPLTEPAIEVVELCVWVDEVSFVAGLLKHAEAARAMPTAMVALARGGARRVRQVASVVPTVTIGLRVGLLSRTELSLSSFLPAPSLASWAAHTPKTRTSGNNACSLCRSPTSEV
jgi:hypothetical protein